MNTRCHARPLACALLAVQTATSSACVLSSKEYLGQYTDSETANASTTNGATAGPGDTSTGDSAPTSTDGASSTGADPGMSTSTSVTTTGEEDVDPLCDAEPAALIESWEIEFQTPLATGYHQWDCLAWNINGDADGLPSTLYDGGLSCGDDDVTVNLRMTSSEPILWPVVVPGNYKVDYVVIKEEGAETQEWLVVRADTGTPRLRFIGVHADTLLPPGLDGEFFEPMVITADPELCATTPSCDSPFSRLALDVAMNGGEATIPDGARGVVGEPGYQVNVSSAKSWQQGDCPELPAPAPVELMVRWIAE